MADNYGEFREKVYVSPDAKGKLITGSALDRWLNDGNSLGELLKEKVTLIKETEEISSGLTSLDTGIFADEPMRIFFKQYRQKKHWRLVYAPIGRHRAIRVWKASWHLIDHGVNVPRPEGYFVNRPGNDWGTSLFCCEALNECYNLDDLIARNRPVYDRLVGHGLFRELARIIHAIHQCGIIHGDLKWSNILVASSDNSIWFVDLDACTFPTEPRRDRLAARDLGRFIVSGMENGEVREPMYELLRVYADSKGLDHSALISKVEPWIRKFMERKKMHI